MKKTYVKPIVTFESFAFSSNIAAGCAQVDGLHAQNACVSYGTQSSPDTGMCTFVSNTVEIFGNSNCVLTPEESPFDLCYHNPTDASKMFMS